MQGEIACLYMQSKNILNKTILTEKEICKPFVI